MKNYLPGVSEPFIFISITDLPIDRLETLRYFVEKKNSKFYQLRRDPENKVVKWLVEVTNLFARFV